MVDELRGTLEDSKRADFCVGYFNLRGWHELAGRSIIDRIDTLLASHPSLSEEELDFIINYDIKYRMGREAEE